MPKAQVFLKRLQCSVGSTLEGVLPGVGGDSRLTSERGAARQLRELPGNLWGFVLMGGAKITMFSGKYCEFWLGADGFGRVRWLFFVSIKGLNIWGVCVILGLEYA